MNKEDVQALQDALALAQKKLALVQAIDDIRDNYPEPAAMLTAIAGCLAVEFASDCCLLYLLDETSGRLSLQAAHDPQQHQQQISSALLAEVAGLTTAVTLSPTPSQQLLAAPIIMGTEKRLGAILLLRAVPFTSQDVELLETAEDQIDSAVMQGYAYQMSQNALSLARQRQRELAMLAALDAIRDQHSEPELLFSAVVSLLADLFTTELSVLFVLDQETGSAEVRLSLIHI
jgi:hypothetical protein